MCMLGCLCCKVSKELFLYVQALEVAADSFPRIITEADAGAEFIDLYKCIQ